jgi:hypothetical protein
MRRFTSTTIWVSIFALVLATTPGPLWADSPHFQFANASISSSTGVLTVSFKEVGLGTGTTSVSISLHVDTATAVYQCFNNGGNHPQAGNKETKSQAVTVSGTFPVSHGQTTASLTIDPQTALSPGSFTCPSGQSLFLQSVSYSGISVTDAFGNSLVATPDTIGPVTLHLLIS